MRFQRKSNFKLQGDSNMASPATLSVRSQSSSLPVATSGPVVFLARLLFAPMFLLAGPSHFSAMAIGYAKASGVPMASFLVPASGLLAVVAGLSILLGYHAKIGAWLAVLFLVPVTFMMHKFWGVADPMAYQMQFAMFMKNLAMIGGALLITQFGAGAWSLDARRETKSR
jgi:putative oxidoreductase